MRTQMETNRAITDYDEPLEKPVVSQDENDCTESTDSFTEFAGESISHYSNNPESKHRITFAPELEVCEIPHREDMTDEEYHLAFYSKNEIAFMNEEQNETADRIEAGKKAKKSTTYRGLEAWTQMGQHEMNQRIFSCVDSVLDEQDKQWTKGRNSTRRIAKASKGLTKTSRKIALELAKQDEKEARKVYEEHLDEHDKAAQEEPFHLPLVAVITNSTIMKKSKKYTPDSLRSLNASSHSMDLGLSMHSHDSCDSGLWSLSSSSILEKPTTPKKKRKSKKKSAAREGKAEKETPAKTTASRRKKINKVMVV
ncbi:unnamed protein product [Cylindrotheca closterium]|uniref:Uncharacterized protein n=1 Tax=Cylindrotheca closterium TaxID=2856 RepID=A0AAD2CKE1_9STRA|nr:unnamed protein product [Cylindrotheca closterium]